MLGALLVTFGVMKLAMFFFHKKIHLARLEMLRQKLGLRGGTAAYLLFYAVLPLFVGGVFFWREMSGRF